MSFSARQILSLVCIPIPPFLHLTMACPERFELPTDCVEDSNSIQLSYGQIVHGASGGIEPQL